MPTVFGTLIVNGSYNGPNIDVRTSGGGQVLPEEKVVVINDYGTYQIVNIKKLKVSEISILDAEGNAPKGDVDMAAQANCRLKVAVQPNGASNEVTWKSSSPTIATVDESGLVKFIKPGAVTITATATDGSGKKAGVTYNVTYKGFSATEKFTASLSESTEHYMADIAIGLQLGDRVQMNIFGADKSSALDPRLFSYDGSDGVSVDANGIITANKADAKATVTASLIGDPLGRKATVSISTIPVQTKAVELVPDESCEEQFVGIDGNGNICGEDIAPVSYALYVDKGKAGSYILQPEAVDSLGNPIEVSKGMFKWTSSDSKVATVKENDDGSATVSIKATADGACTITATANDQGKTQGHIAIHVMEKSPRLEAGKLTLDVQKQNEASLALVSSYGNKITGVEFVSSGDLLDVKYDAENECITVSAKDFIKNQSISGKLNVSTELDKYSLPLTVTVKNSAPSVTTKQVDKFNLFYLDSNADISVAVKNETVTGVQLDGDDFVGEWDGEKLTVSYKSATPSAKPNTKATLKIELDGYAFPVEKAVTIASTTTKPSLSLDPSSIVFSVVDGISNPNASIYVYDKSSKKYLAEENCESVFVSLNGIELDAYWAGGQLYIKADEGAVPQMKSGKLMFKYKEYNWAYPVNFSNNLSVSTAMPGVKPKADSIRVDLNHPYTWFGAGYSTSNANIWTGNVVSADMEAVKPDANTALLDVFLYNGLDRDFLVEKFGNETDLRQGICVRFRDPENLPAAGTYKFKLAPKYKSHEQGVLVQLPEFVVSVVVQATVPTAKLEKSSLTLNNVFPSQRASTQIYGTDENMFGEHGVYAIRPKNAAAEAANIKFDVDYSYGVKLIAGISDVSNPPAAGSYSYEVIMVRYAGGTESYSEPLPLTVKVVNTKPKVTLSSTTLNLNRAMDVAGAELATAQLKCGTAGYTVVGSIVEANDSKADVNKIVVYPDTGDKVVFGLDATKLPAAGSYKFSVTPIVQRDGSSETAELSPLSLTVKVYSNASVSATVSASGKLDAVQRGTSAITYTVTKLANVVGEVTNVDLEGADKDKFTVELGEPNAKGQVTAKLMLKADEAYSVKASYKVKLAFTVNESITAVTKDISVKVSSSAIKLSAQPATQYIYQSQNRDRSVNWTVKLSSPVDANIDLDSIEIGEVGLLKRSLVDMTENIDFELVDDTLTVRVTIKDTSALNAGKSYTLPLLIKAEGCATDAGASKLSLKLTVKK